MVDESSRTLAETLSTWRENVYGIDLEKHVQMNNGVASSRYPVELVIYFEKVVREDYRSIEDLSDVAVFSAARSPWRVPYRLVVTTIMQCLFPVDADPVQRYFARCVEKVFRKSQFFL